MLGQDMEQRAAPVRQEKPDPEPEGTGRSVLPRPGRRDHLASKASPNPENFGHPVTGGVGGGGHLKPVSLPGKRYYPLGATNAKGLLVTSLAREKRDPSSFHPEG